MRTYLLSLEAETDLQEIEEYSALHWGNAKAAEYIRDLFNTFELLTENPGLGKPRPTIKRNLLFFPAHQHTIVFSIHRKNGEVRILRVLHSAMNIAARLRKRKK